MAFALEEKRELVRTLLPPKASKDRQPGTTSIYL